MILYIEPDVFLHMRNLTFPSMIPSKLMNLEVEPPEYVRCKYYDSLYGIKKLNMHNTITTGLMSRPFSIDDYSQLILSMSIDKDTPYHNFMLFNPDIFTDYELFD